jgi:hypothetical protein
MQNYNRIRIRIDVTGVKLVLEGGRYLVEVGPVVQLEGVGVIELERVIAHRAWELDDHVADGVRVEYFCWEVATRGRNK